MRILRLLLLLLLLCPFSVKAQVGMPVADSAQPASVPDSWMPPPWQSTTFPVLLTSHPMLQSVAVPTVQLLEKKKPFANRTADFYLLLLLALLLGVIRYANPRYFSMLWRAFYHPTHTSQALRDQLEADPLPNIGMNFLFACSMGAYLYALVRIYNPYHQSALPAPLLLGAFIAGVAVVYVVKWLAIRASGWAFGVSSLTSQYLFNVYLINKIMAIVLLPFTLFLAFADVRGASSVVVFISALLIVALIAMRYTRSWLALSRFFSNSRFHFLTYFCASEILPLAVLTKLVALALFS